MNLLGVFSLEYAGKQVQVASPRIQTLLAYLALHLPEPQSRQHLAFLLWPDSTESQAFTNLRTLLHRVNVVLQDHVQLLHIDSQNVAWNPKSDIVLDVTEFKAALEASAAIKQNDGTAACEVLDRAAALTIGIVVFIFSAIWQGLRLAMRGEYTKLPDQLEAVRSKRRPFSHASDFARPLFMLAITLIIAAMLAGLAMLDQPTLGQVFLQFITAFTLAGLGIATAMLSHRLGQTRPTSTAAPITPMMPQAYTIRIPRSTPWQPEHAHHFLTQLLSIIDRLAFQIIAENNGIYWQVVDYRLTLSADIVKQLIHAVYPDAEVESLPVGARFTGRFYRSTVCFATAEDFVSSIRTVNDLSKFDPLTAVTQLMNELQPGECMTYSVVVTSAAGFARRIGEKLITKSTIHPLGMLSPEGVGAAVHDIATDQTRAPKYRASDQQYLQNKLNHPLYQGVCFIQIDAPTVDRAVKLTVVDSIIEQYAVYPYNTLLGVFPDEKPRAVQSAEDEWETGPMGLLSRWVTGTDQAWTKFRLIMNPSELASLWHLPHRDFKAHRIQWSGSRNVPLPAGMTGREDGVCIGINYYAGREEPVFVPEASRQNHMNIIGMTGMGKSNLMHQLIHQDIHSGRGVAVIDPHGKLVQDILRASIPPEREEDVVVLDIADTQHPMPMNPLARVSDLQQSEIQANRVMAVLDKLYDSNWGQTPRMANALLTALMTLQMEQQPTVRDIPRLFLDADYRAQLLSRIDDDVILEFWYDEYENFSLAQQQQIREPIIYRIRSFYRNSYLYPILCHPQSLDLAALMRQNKIILISLAMDERYIQETEQTLIGALLFSQLQLAAMREQRQTPFYVYIDEVQRFVTTPLDRLFSEIRKYGIALTVANQYLGQLTGSTLNALMGNVGATIAFKIGEADARALAPFVKPEFELEDLIAMDQFQAVAKLQYNGTTQPAFSLRTAAPIAPPTPQIGDDTEGRIRRLSHRNYTAMTQQDVLDWLSSRYPRPTRVAAVDDDLSFYEE